MNKELTALQAWKEIKDFVVNGHSLALETEEKGFPLIEKALKVLDIIKEKIVNVGSFIKCCASLSYEEYKKTMEQLA